MVMPGNRSLPLCVRGIECPPSRATRERSRLNFSTNQSTSVPLLAQSTLATSGLLAPPFIVSDVNNSIVSLIPFAAWVLVSAPLMPLVAFVEFPPQKEDLSSNTTFPPFSKMVFAADTPANPPPTTTAVSPMSAPDNSASEVSFIFEPSMHLAACLPATRPNTTQSSKELPPRRLFPWTPPATSPAAYNPLIAFPFWFTTKELTSISKPPMQ